MLQIMKILLHRLVTAIVESSLEIYIILGLSLSTLLSCRSGVQKFL